MKRIINVVMTLLACQTTIAGDNSGGVLGKVIGGFLDGLGEAVCNPAAVAPDIPDLKTTTMSDVDTAWLQQKTFKQFCGIPLGEVAEIDGGFLNKLETDIGAKYENYYYDSQINAIVYEGAGWEYSWAAKQFFTRPWTSKADVRVVITPLSHKVAGVWLNYKMDEPPRYKPYQMQGDGIVYYRQGAEDFVVQTSREIIERAFEDAVGKKFFVESGDLNIGNGTQYICFKTKEYPIDKTHEKNVLRKICTSVMVADNETWNLLAVEGKDFVAKVNERIARRAEDDKKEFIKQFCGIKFGDVVNENAMVRYDKDNGGWRSDSVGTVLVGDFALDNPIVINGTKIEVVRIFSSVQTRRIYRVLLLTRNRECLAAIQELLQKKYPWRKCYTRIVESGFTTIYRYGNVGLANYPYGIEMWNFDYTNLAREESEAAKKKSLNNAFDNL